jgi:1-acyl-sn-glycerol-3-phosphate acyltransferase
MATSAERLTGIISAMLAELRAGAAPAITLDAELERDLGIDSLARVELTLRIEHAFGVRLPEGIVVGARTVRELLAALARAAPRLAPDIAREAPLASAAEAAGEPREAATLPEVLAWHAARHGERPHVTLLENDTPAQPLTYGELAAGSRAAARGLRRRGLEPGQAVVIMLPTSRAFFQAFLGVLIAGGVPVPIYPPFRWSQIEEHLRRQAGIVDNCAAAMLVTVAGAQAAARLLQARASALRHVVTVDELAVQADEEFLHPAASDTALLQYTSGSTGQPKGVVLTHANLLANIRAMGEAVAASAEDVCVSWLPLYHDMGLIGAWLGSLYYGVRLALIPTQAFLARPARWLWAIHRYRGTLSAAPNFAYEILAAKVPDDELRGLDLSSWRVAFNGAEPVRATTLERFARRFAPFGFDPRAATPVYGLAECAVGLTFPPLGRGPLINTTGVVSCGRPLPGHQARVVDEAGREAPERVEGRVEFRGPSATSGYFNNPQATRALLRGEWLDTGDLGYFAQGELYITGRVKDVIIRGGQHIHPYDLEEAVGALAGVRKGCVAVFGATDRMSGTERVVVVAETRVADPEHRRALRRRIAELALAHLSAPADDIVLAGARVVLKTSSGKIRRAACRELYERGVLGAAQRPVALQLARLASSAALGAARRLARRIGGGLYALYVWLLFALAAAVGGAVLCVLPGKRSRERWTHGVALGLMRLSRLEVRVHGAARLPAIFTANHASYVDSLILAAVLPAGVHFVAKREFASVPLAGGLLRRFGTRFVERFATQAAIEDARELAEAARAGESLVMFPEGTFTRAPGLGAFHMSAFVAAAQSGQAVVPVALRGTRSVLRAESWLPRRRPVELFIDAPLWPRGPAWSDAVALRDQTRRTILAQCGEPDRAAYS